MSIGLIEPVIGVESADKSIGAKLIGFSNLSFSRCSSAIYFFIYCIDAGSD